MGKVTRERFVENLQGEVIDCGEAARAKRLSKLDVSKADLNGDHRISGAKEQQALFDAIDHFDKDADPSLLTTTDKRGRLTDSGKLVEAVCNLAADPQAFESHDPLAKRVYLTKGPFAGEPINLAETRSVSRLRGAEAAKYGASRGEIVVANVFHADQWWVARVPANAVAEVILQGEIKKGDTQAAHTQLRFAFKQPVVLVPQYPDANQASVELKDLVFSVEGAGTKSYKYDVVKGLFDNFAICYRMISGAQCYQDTVVESLRTVKQRALPLSDKEKSRAFLKAVDLADKTGLTKMYNTLARNCTTEAFDVIDEAAGRGPLRHVLGHLLTNALPFNVKSYLALRGMLRDAVDLPNFEREYQPT